MLKYFIFHFSFFPAHFFLRWKTCLLLISYFMIHFYSTFLFFFILFTEKKRDSRNFSCLFTGSCSSSFLFFRALFSASLCVSHTNSHIVLHLVVSLICLCISSAFSLFFFFIKSHLIVKYEEELYYFAALCACYFVLCGIC